MEQTEEIYNNQETPAEGDSGQNNELAEGEVEEEEEYEQPALNDNCILCNKMPCCPEHCCDWDNCRCGDCPNCQDSSQQEDQETKPPRKIFRSIDNSENFTGVGKKKMRPKKYIKIDKDACLITNFEVDDVKDLIDERNGVKIYGGGVRGIRALKQDKEDDEEVKETDDEKLKRAFIETHGDKFKRFEHKIGKKSRLIIK